MNKLDLQNISLRIGKSDILSNISFSVNENEFMVLVGPSGSGKSTILRIISGLLPPTSGDIYIDGNLVNNVSPKDRDISMVFQNYALYPHLTIFDNIAFPLAMRKVHPTQIKKQVEVTAEMLNLTNHLFKRPKELSGGERQRVALGRAIVRKPKIFLMDEPLSNLDAKLRTQMRTEILKLQKSLKATFIYVTHDQIEALTMGDRIAILRGGEIQQINTPENIYFTPNNKFVAGFIGSPPMNFIPANDMLDVSIPSSSSSKNTILGIRPEYVQISTADKGNSATIDFIEMLGSECVLHLTMNSSVKILSKIPFNNAYKVGDTVGITFYRDKILFFDTTSEKIIL